MEEILTKSGNELTCPIAVFIKDKKILLGLRNYTPDKWKTVSVWTVPGGRCDPGETVEQALRREVYEEVGFKNFTIESYLGSHSGSRKGDKIEVFACSSIEEPANMEPHKFTEWKWLSIADWPNNFINPNVEDLFKSLLK